MQIGEAIRAARETKGLSQPELAEQVGVARETVSRWETGVFQVPKRTRIAIETVLGPLEAEGTVQAKPKGKRSRKP